MKIFYKFIIAVLATFIVSGCSSYQEALDNASKVTTTAKSVFHMAKDNAPEDDYVLGLKIASSVISQPLYKSNHPRVTYVNNIVQTLKRYSKKPFVYEDYKVLIVKDQSFNAYALPGGIIVLHDGVFKYTYNEEELAAILGHEIGHIENNHFLQDSKVEDMSSILSFAADKKTDGKDNKILKNLLSGMKNQILNGYSVEQEAEADQTAIKLLSNAGYETRALGDVLKNLKTRTNSYGGANYPKDRLALLEQNELYFKDFKNISNKKLRERRFDKEKYERY